MLVKTNHEPEFHRQIRDKLIHVLDEEGNPGNNILPRIPDISKIFSDDSVRGALTEYIGRGLYYAPASILPFKSTGK